MTFRLLTGLACGGALVSAAVSISAHPRTAGPVVALAMAASMIVATRTFERRVGTYGPEVDDRRAALAAAGRAGLTGGAATLGVGMATATIAVLAGGVAAAVFVAAVAAPATALWLRGSPGRAPGATCPVAGPGRCEDEAPARAGWSARLDLQRLSTRELCQGWQASYWVLGELAPGTALGDLIDSRQMLLTEIERRDPTGFARWLASGAAPGSSPLPYLGSEHEPF